MKEISKVNVLADNARGYEFLGKAMAEGLAVYLKMRNCVFKIYVVGTELITITSKLEIKFMIIEGKGVKGKALKPGEIRFYETDPKIDDHYFVFHKIIE